MNIFELLSFDIVEFATSTGGILVIVGILFLIVGIVVLFMGKGKNKENTVNLVEPSIEEPAPVAVAPEPTVIASNEVLENNVVEPVVEPINFNQVETLDEPSLPPVVETNATQPEVLEPSVVEPVIMEEPVVETPTMETPVVSESTPTLEPQPMVSDSISPESELNSNEPRAIYGGANPLDNTSPIPTNVVREAYNGATPVVDPMPAVVEQPVVLETPVIPEVQPVVEVPVTPVVPETVQQSFEEKQEEIEKLEF